jgi:hypothetical protein
MSIPYNPFGGPFAGAPNIGGNPLDDEGNMGIRCPKCKSTNFHAFTNQYGITRKCLEKGCGLEWSGGSMAAGKQLMSDLDLLPDGSVAPDLDMPLMQYTGAGFRDPSKNIGGDDEW